MKINKRGMLLAEETLKMVIAVIALVFLVYFLTSLYFSRGNQEKSREAEAVLNRISAIYSGLEDGESEIYEIPNPSGWNFFSFVKGGEGEIPNSCGGVSCICICDETLLTNQVKECFKNGRCLKFERISSFESIKINNPGDILTNILIKKEGNKISIRRVG